MRSLLLFLAASLPLLGSTVTCTGSDASAIQTSLNAGGTTTLIGSCNIGSTTLGTNANGTTLTTTTGASVTYTGTGFALNINHNNVTVTNITWSGGGLHTTQTSIFTPQSGLTITGNTFQNITMANSNNIAILGDGYWSFVTITGNTFHNITSVPLASISTSTNVENCTPASICTSDQYPCSWSGGINNCYGSGITNLNGLDNTTITFNHFDTILGNAMSLKFDWTIGGTAGAFTSAANNNWSYNTGVNLHRMFEESGGGGNSCPGGCQYGNTTKITNWKIAGNFGTYVAPYGDSYGLSIPQNAAAPQIINNTFDITQAGGPGFGFEEGNQNELFQGNVSGINAGLTTWGTPNVSAIQAPGFTIFQQNNIFYGPPGTLNGVYYGDEGFNYGGTRTNRFNINGGNCPISSNCAASNLATAFITSGSPSTGCTANAASFPSGGNGTWCFYATNQLSIVNVQFFIDVSSTPTVTQEIQDLSSTFTSDARWQYHATINTSSLSGGSHTILATATDVSGATSSHSQTFTTGSGPGASFSPTSLNFGSITLGSSSSPQTTTLTNTGTTTLTISGGVTITGAAAGDFSKTTTCTSTLAASATCTVTVTFTPTVLGSRIAFVTITDNAAGSPHQVQLTGGASLCQSGNLISNCDLGTGAISPWGYNGGSFGTIAVDNTGPSGTFAAHITATAPVSPGSNDEFFQDSLTFGSNGTMMQLTFSCQATRSQPVNILGILSVSPFTSYGLAWMPSFPTSYGTYPNCKSPFFKVQGSPTAGSGRLTFQADNSTTGDQFQITNVNLVPAGSVPASTVSASSVTFTSQAIGTTQTGSAITITNNGVANLVVSGIAYSSGNTGDFGQTNTCVGTPVVPAGTCTITPTFTPATPGSRVSNLVITSNDSSVSPQTLPVSGTGTGTTEVQSIFSILTSHGSVYFGFTTSTASNAVRVRYSTTGCASGTGGTVQTNFLNNIPAVFAALPVGGLAPSTQYHICAEPSKDGGTTWLSGGPELVVTTAALPSPHPGLPIAPLTFNTAYPDTTGYNVQSASTDAAFSTAYGTACTDWETNARGQIINLAPGTLLNTGPYAFTCKPPDIHTIAVADFTLPSTINWPNHGFSEGDLIEFGETYALNITLPSGGGCNVGQGTTASAGIQVGQRYPVHVVDTSNIQVRCLPTSFIADPNVAPPTPPIMIWTGAPIYAGSDHMVAVAYKSTGNDSHGKPIWQRRMPTSPYAVTPQFIVQTTGNLPPEHTAITPAWSSSLFSFHATSSYISSTAFQHPFIIFGDPDPNAQIPIGPYRIVGCEITTDNYNPVSSDPYFWSTLVWTHPVDDQIIFDRCYYHIPDGNREYRGQQWDGSNVAWLDSYFDNLVYMKSAVVGLSVTGSSHTISITAGSNYIPNLSHYTLASNETITLSGSGSGRVRAYFDLANSGAFTVAVPTGITAACSPASCTSAVSSGTTSGSCLASIDTQNSATYADLPHYGSGESSAASIGCADVTSGSISSAGPYNTSVSQWVAEGDAHMIGGTGPGPYVFDDNFYDGAGITWHFDDSGGFGFRGNYTWNRNYNKQSTKWMYGSADSLHMVPGNRQPLEWKGGQYIEAKGNVFDGVFRDDIPDSGFFAIQPLNGGQVTDVNFVSNTLRHGSAMLQGPTNTCGGTASSCGLSMRIHLDNTLTYDINGYVYTSPDPNGSNGPGLGWGNQFSSVEDPFIEHQTDGTPNRGPTSWLLSNTSVAVEGYTDRFGIHWFSGVPTQVAGMYGDGSGVAAGVPPGCSGLSNFALMNCQFTSGPGNASYSFQNLLLGGYTDNSVPSGQSTVSTMTTAFGSLPNLYLATGTIAGTTSTVKWFNPTTDTTANYRLLPASPYKAGNNSIDKSADLGIDADRIIADQGIVQLRGTPANLITSSGFSVSYIAADSAVAYVGYSTTNNVTTAVWVADGGGARARNTAITGLSTKTHYFYWVFGSGNYLMSQKSGDVWTN